MSKRRIRTGGPREAHIPQHIFTDHDWIRHHQAELIEQYGECYMIVYHEQVLGAGKTRDEALDNAEHNLAPDVKEIAAMVEWVGSRPRIGGLLRVVDMQAAENEE